MIGRRKPVCMLKDDAIPRLPTDVVGMRNGSLAEAPAQFRVAREVNRPTFNGDGPVQAQTHVAGFANRTPWPISMGSGRRLDRRCRSFILMWKSAEFFISSA